MYPWEIRKKRKEELEKLLQKAGLKLVKIKDTSITLGCLITVGDKNGKFNIVDELDNTKVYDTGLTSEQAAKRMAQYTEDAQKSYPKLSGDEALSRHMDDIYQINSFKKIKNKFPKEALPKKGYQIKFTYDIKGIFRRSNGNIINNKIYNFVITSSGELRIGLKHHFLGNAQDVLAAGSLRFKNGKISQIDNLSGHYKPNIEESLNFVEVFRVSGIPINRALLKIYKFKDIGNGYDVSKLVKNILINKLNL